MKKKENKTEFIIVRVTKTEKDNLIKKSANKLSKFVRVQLGLD